MIEEEEEDLDIVFVRNASVINADYHTHLFENEDVNNEEFHLKLEDEEIDRNDEDENENEDED